MEDRIKVLQMIGSLNIGGSQSMVINILKSIDREKIMFDFIVDKPDELELADTVKALGSNVFYIPGFNGFNAHRVAKEWDLFLSKHEHEYQILHSHVRSYAALFLPIAKKHGLKTIIHSHSTSNGKGLKAIAKQVLQLPLRLQADYFLSCSMESAAWLYGKSVIKKNNFNVLRNGISLNEYAFNLETRKKQREKLGVTTDCTVFIHVGRLHQSKNHQFLLNIFAEVVKSMNAVLLLVGDGELRDSIVNTIHELGLEDRVKMLGARTDVPELLMAADCLLLPSKWEGLPVTVVEAQASGLPCLIANNITDEVVISDLVTKLPIDKAESLWVEVMKSMDYSRKDVTEDIHSSGFDAKDSVKDLTEIYYALTKQVI